MPSRLDDLDLDAETQPLLGVPQDEECGPGGWPPKPSKGLAEREFVSNFGILFFTCVCAVISLPFAFGSWCWPVFLGMTVTQSGIWLCHSVQFAVMLTCLSNLCQYYVYLGQLRRDGSFWSKQGPMLVVLLSSLLLMVHPTVFILKDLQLIKSLCDNSIAMLVFHGCSDVGILGLAYAALWGTEGFEALRAGLQQKGWM